MKHFKVLQYDNVDALAEAIEIAINDNWEIVGHMFVSKDRDHSTDRDHVLYNQPIMKTTRDTNRPWNMCIVIDCPNHSVKGSNYCHSHKEKMLAKLKDK